jgi:RecB family exonuclease
MIQTIIAPTIHRAKQLEQQSGNPLARSLTLENFITAYYERYGEHRLISTDEALSIMSSQFMAQHRTHFDYITDNSDAMEQIGSFILDLKRNNVSVEEFDFSKEKQEELQALYQSYDVFLEHHCIADNADRDQFVLESIIHNPEMLNVFGNIIVDDFTQNDIHFETSKTQSGLLNVLHQHGALMSAQEVEKTEPNFFAPSPAPFDIFDEAACALKIARKLLETGAQADDIIIVTPAIDEYAPVFETLYNAYGLKGYTSIGTPLNTLLPLLKNSDSDILSLARQRQMQIKNDIDKTSQMLQSMGIRYDSIKAYEKALKKARIKSRTKEGILITEPNQLLSQGHIGHLIFVGTDMGHFPPVTKEGFLASTLQRETFLHANSSYLSSYNHYLQMKAISDNLYIVTATYKGKTKLARSHIITDTCQPFEVGDIMAPHELPKSLKRLDNDQLDPYLDALAQSQNSYDGYDAGGYEVKLLSASQLGSYAMCPRRYFFERVLGLSVPDKPEEGLESSEKGTIMHECFELFAIDAKAGAITISAENDTAIKEYMLDKAHIAYQGFLTENEVAENINHRLYFQELTRGLSEENPGEGVLLNFLDFITQNYQAINGFRDSEFEMEFRLDNDFNVVENDKLYFIKGFIDRIDIKNDEIRIVDYKSKKVDAKIDKEKLQQMRDLKDMQLSLYILYAKRAFGDKRIESYLQTFKSKYGHAEFVKAATYEMAKEGEYLHYDEAFESSLIERIKTIKASIEEGDFHYDDSDEKYCKYCDFTLMCR